MARSEFINALDSLEGTLEDLDGSIKELIDALESGGGGFGGGGGGGFAGGKGAKPGRTDAPSGEGETSAVDSILSAGRKHPVVAGLATIAAAAGPAIGAGFVSAAQGGSFEAGALSAVNRTLGKVPFVGEASGIAQGARVEERVGRTVGSQIAEVEARGGAVSPEFRKFLLEESFEIESRREKSVQNSRIEIEKLAAGGATGFSRATTRDLIIGVLPPPFGFVLGNSEMFR